MHFFSLFGISEIEICHKLDDLKVAYNPVLFHPPAGSIVFLSSWNRWNLKHDSPPHPADTLPCMIPTLDLLEPMHRLNCHPSDDIIPQMGLIASEHLKVVCFLWLLGRRQEDSK
jgi:hypothetical protein